MKKSDQRRIVREMVKSLKKSLMNKVSRAPESWDGHELRELLYIEAENFRSPQTSNSGSRRLKFLNDLSDVCV